LHFICKKSFVASSLLESDSEDDNALAELQGQVAKYISLCKDDFKNHYPSLVGVVWEMAKNVKYPRREGAQKDSSEKQLSYFRIGLAAYLAFKWTSGSLNAEPRQKLKLVSDPKVETIKKFFSQDLGMTTEQSAEALTKDVNQWIGHLRRQYKKFGLMDEFGVGDKQSVFVGFVKILRVVCPSGFPEPL